MRESRATPVTLRQAQGGDAATELVEVQRSTELTPKSERFGGIENVLTTLAVAIIR